MSNTHTSIEWANHTWNPIVGCSRVSHGCEACYAERLVGTRMSKNPMMKGRYDGLTVATSSGPRWTGTVRLFEERLEEPLHWKDPKRVFVNSMSDLFHESLTDEQIELIFGVMALAQKHTFQVLTKRPERALRFFGKRILSTAQDEIAGAAMRLSRRWKLHQGRGVVWDGRGPDPWRYNLVGVSPTSQEAKMTAKQRVENRRPFPGWPLPNVWIGVSVEDQTTATTRIPLLLKLPAAKRFLSCEPLLGPLDIKSYLHYLDDLTIPKVRPDWVIVGGESGPDRRPMDLDWARSIREQCRETGVPFFYKQGGGLRAGTNDILDGRTHKAFPV